MPFIRCKNLRYYFFWLILVVLPLLFFALLEFGARLAGWGTDYPLFVSVPNEPKYLQPNPEVIKRYFARPELAPHVSPDTLYFLAKKPADSFRIVIVGESSAAGFPYGRFGSLAGMLEQRLKPLYPERQFEIINVAMAAINSYAMRDFTEEIVSIDPDLVLIYAGHNEYLGVMGVGSSLAARSGRWQTLTYIALRHSYVFQALDALVAGWYLKSAPAPAQDERTLMARIAAKKNIPLGSPAYEQGIRQFELNMQDILSSYRAAGIPVIIGTLASNERNQPPFASHNRSDQQLQKLLSSARHQLAAGKEANAEQLLQRLITDYPGSADGHYALAQTYEALKNFSVALNHYRLAADHDLLRFRAPQAINDIIRRVSNQSGIYLADVQLLLRQHSREGIIGTDFMLEHLHPNAEGYFWLSEAYFNELQRQKILPPSTFQLASDQAIYWQPVSEIDKIFARWTIAKLTSDYPFTEQPKKFTLGELNTPEQRIAARRYLGEASWLITTQEAFEHYQRGKNWRAALITVGQLSDALPMNHELALIAGKISRDIHLIQLALFYAERGLRLHPHHEDLLMLKAHALYLSKRFVDSKRVLQQVLTVNPRHPLAIQFIAQPWATSLE